MSFELIGLAIISGLLIGGMQAFLGLGGAIVAVPLLYFGFGFPIHEASIASLGVIIFSSTIGLIPKVKQKVIDYKIGLRVWVLAIPGSIIGGLLAPVVADEIISLTFAAILFTSAGISMLHREELAERKLAWPWFVLISTAIGFLAGFVGFGGGIFAVPALLVAFRMSVIRATSTALFIVVLNSLVALAVRSGEVFDVAWLYPAIIAVVAAIAAANLAKAAKKTDPKITKRLLLVTLLALGLAMLVSALV